MAEHALADRELSLDEGVYVDDPADLGGETVLGWARNKCPDEPVWPMIDELKKSLGLKGPVRDPAAVARLSAAILANPRILAWSSARRKSVFWDFFSLDSCASQSVAGEFYNGAYNVGRSRQRLVAVRALNVLNRNGVDWPDLNVGMPAKIPDGISRETFWALPAWLRMPALMVYPPALGWGDAEKSALWSCLKKGREEALFKVLSGIREEWYVSWMERDRTREGQPGVLSRPFSRA